VGAGAKVDVGDGQCGQLRDPQAGCDLQRQQGVVASSGPGGLVGGVQQRVGLGLGEVGDEGLVVAFGWDRQDSLDDRGVLGVVQGGEAEQGVMAARRALRVRTLLPRWCSRWFRNAPTSAASRSATSRREGALPVCLKAKPNRSLKVSR
jgi:hypothetical protein